MQDNWLFIVNPSSGSGLGRRSWSSRLTELQQHGMVIQAWESAYPGNIEELVAKAVDEGYRKLASYGGDGTLNALVNGAMRQQGCPPDQLLLAHLSCGTGNDWCKTFQIPLDTHQWVQMIKRNLQYPHDVGIADIHRDNRPLRHYFINIAGLAYDSHVVRKIDDHRLAGSFIKGKLLYDVVVAGQLLTYRPPILQLRHDGITENMQLFNIAISICRYNGGGMMPTPYADPSDGLLDVTTFRKMPLWKVVRDLPKMSKGTFFSNPLITWFRTAELQVDGVNAPDLVEADGESIGHTPAKFTVQRHALRFVINTPPPEALPA